jgi:hypothetical protein
MKTDQHVAKNLRTRIYQVLRGLRKHGSLCRLIGCSVDQFRRHISARFLPGMSWANYGQWHVDHVKPCASFNLADSVQQRACFHYANLQPLWAKDNIAKNDK